MSALSPIEQLREKVETAEAAKKHYVEYPSTAFLRSVLDEADREASREEIDLAIGSVLFHVSNWPESLQPHVAGRDFSGLRRQLVDAIVSPS